MHFQEANVVMPSDLDCETERRFDCGIKEMGAGRIVLIIIYACVMVYSIIGMALLRVRSLLFAFVASLIAVAGIRIILFSLPLYYTWKLTQQDNLKGVVLLLDIIPESVYFVSVFLLLISYVFYVRTLESIMRRREMSLYASSTVVGPKDNVRSKWKVFTALAVCVLFILVIVASFIGNLIWAFACNSDVYNKDDPVADSIFIVLVALVFEVVLIVTTVRYPYRLKTGLLIALFPGLKALFSTYEWYIWSLKPSVWVVLWVGYFLFTEILPSVVLLTMLIKKSRKKKLSRGPERTPLF